MLGVRGDLSLVREPLPGFGLPFATLGLQVILVMCSCFISWSVTSGSPQN